MIPYPPAAYENGLAAAVYHNQYHHHPHHHHPHHHHQQHYHHHHHHQPGSPTAMAAAAAAAAAAAVEHHLSPDSGRPPVHHRLFFKTPRVVPDQRERFRQHDVFKRNARELEVRYTLYRDRPLHERQAKFLQGCREGHVEVSHASTGLVLVLTWNPMQNGYGGPHHHPPHARLNCDFGKEPGKVHIVTPLIVEGVSVRWRGWIDLDRLEGVACVEFDEEMAEAEDALLRQQVSLYEHRLKEIEAHRKRYDEQIQQFKKAAQQQQQQEQEQF